jgi:hypothetical protein
MKAKHAHVLVTATAIIMAIVTAIAVVTTAEHDKPADRSIANQEMTEQVCDSESVSQLPDDVVDIVNAAQSRHKIEGLTGEDILVRQDSLYLQTVAFAVFDSRYCGYWGNINGRPTDYGRTADVPESEMQRTFEYADGDHVTVVRNGLPFDNPNQEVCIGNTPPTAFMVHGDMIMIRQCDRTYPHETWTQEHPDLSA